MGRVSTLASAVVLVLAAKSAAADPARVAVIPGFAVNLDVSKVDALGQDIAQALTSQLVIDAVGGLDVRRQLPAEGLPADCVSNATCIADIAKRTGASQLLFVVMVGGAGANVQIDTTWVDAASGQHASRPAIDLASSTDEAARSKFEQVAHSLLPDAQVRPKAPPPTTRVSIETHATDGTPRHFTRNSLIAGGVAGVGLVAGVPLWLETRSKYNTCDSNRMTCTQGDRDSIKHFALAADITFGVALAGAIATGIMYATSGEAPRVIVTPTAEGATASWIGRF